LHIHLATILVLFVLFDVFVQVNHQSIPKDPREPGYLAAYSRWQYVDVGLIVAYVLLLVGSCSLLVRGCMYVDLKKSGPNPPRT